MPNIIPEIDDLIDAGKDLGMHVTRDDAVVYHKCLGKIFAAYELVDKFPDNIPEVHYPRNPGYAPKSSENYYNAWATKVHINGAKQGSLFGKSLVLKDNICLAGVPMMNGSSVYRGYVPEVDATVVKRVLDAGVKIIGKAHCESFCYSGGSHTNDTGHVKNKHKEQHSAGGSSSGCAVLVAIGEADLAIGCDQAGSIRIPASFCGICGLKPTYGLVPYSGISASEMTVDHVGPMTRNVANNADLLEVLAGADGLDPRQQGHKSDKYSEGLDRGVKGLKIGVLKEAFGLPNSEPEVDESVMNAAHVFTRLGATVETVSIPIHRNSGAIRTPIAVEGGLQMMLKGDGFGTNWKGLYVPSLIQASKNWRYHADELPDTLKYMMLFGQYMMKKNGHKYYAKAQNLVRKMTELYDKVLYNYDILIMPTVPMTASPLPKSNSPKTEIISRAHEMMANTAAFTVTGHPAFSMPCGVKNDLPIGLMLVAKRFDEKTIYRAAYAYEKEINCL